jgi:ferritin-like metal-binding protein YciE
MAPNDLDDQLIKYLTDAHSIEHQALEQMKRAPGIAGDPTISEQFSQHLTETEEHERRVRERLDELAASPSKLKDLAGKVTGIGFALFAKFNPDTPGKLVAHAYSYEHMELAAYDLLSRVAERAGDTTTATLARQIGEQERAMAERLDGDFDRAVEASLRELSPDDIGKQLDKYLADAHAIEAQAVQLLDKGSSISGAEELSAAFAEHLDETHEHQGLIEGRLDARGGSPNRLKDAGLSLGALNWGGFFGAQPDTPAKLAGFAYAFEHLEIASYELLRRVAQRAGDADTVRVAEQILAQERAAAERIHSLFEPALDAALEAQSVGAAR